MPMNRQILLAARPEGAPGPQHFKLAETPLPQPGEGEVLLKTLWLSLDPYMRGRMSAARSYAKPVEIGEAMEGGTVSRVEASRHKGFAAGDVVLSRAGWQEYALSDGAGLRKLDPKRAPLSTALGVLGMPGMTAYAGLLAIGEPKAGETVVIGAATGAVGAVAGQIAKIKGCRAVGVAGGREKCDYAVRELGFDACIDRREPELGHRLEELCPDGVDVYVELTGGAITDAVLPLLNTFARVPVIGLVAHYNATALPEGRDRVPWLLRQTLTKRLRIQGMIVWDYAALEPDFRRDVAGWIREGRLRYREDVAEGLENAPAALIGMLEGRNFGKQLVRVGPDPGR